MRKDEQGDVIVEATIVFPVAILVFFALMYAALFVCQGAILQASLEDALIYYKHTNTDTYVSATSSMSFENSKDIIGASGNLYEKPKYLDPYRHIGSSIRSAVTGKSQNINSRSFESFFKSVYGHMFFENGENIQITVSEQNFVIYRRVTVKAVQTVSSPVNLAFIGASNSMQISAEATVVVVDGDDLVRDIDFAADTKVGKIAVNTVGKLVEFYNRFKKRFGI